MYNEKHKLRIAEETRLPNSEGKVWEILLLADTEIDVSGKVCKAKVYRTENGNIEIFIDEDGIYENDGWLADGATTEVYGDEINICQFNHND